MKKSNHAAELDFRKYTKKGLHSLSIPIKCNEISKNEPQPENSFSNGRSGQCYLSAKVVSRIINCQDHNGNIIAPLTSKEIDTLIFLATICDDNGIVDILRYKDVASITTDETLKTLSLSQKVSKREYSLLCIKSFYNALNGLKEKEFIDYRKATGKPYYRIQILDNNINFSKKDKYLSLSRDCFVPGTDQFKKFAKLPSGCKRLFLLFLFSVCNHTTYYFSYYKNQKNLACANLERITSELRFTSINTTICYAKKIGSFLGESSLVKDEHMGWIMYWTVTDELMALKKTTSPSKERFSYFGHKLHTFIDQYTNLSTFLTNIHLKDAIYQGISKIWWAILSANRSKKFKRDKKTCFAALKFAIKHYGLKALLSPDPMLYILYNE